MKRRLTTLLGLLCVASLVGCGKKDKKIEETAPMPTFADEVTFATDTTDSSTEEVTVTSATIEEKDVAYFESIKDNLVLSAPLRMTYTIQGVTMDARYIDANNSYSAATIDVSNISDETFDALLEDEKDNFTNFTKELYLKMTTLDGKYYLDASIFGERVKGFVPDSSNVEGSTLTINAVDYNAESNNFIDNIKAIESVTKNGDIYEVVCVRLNDEEAYDIQSKYETVLLEVNDNDEVVGLRIYSSDLQDFIKINLEPITELGIDPAEYADCTELDESDLFTAIFGFIGGVGFVGEAESVEGISNFNLINAFYSDRVGKLYCKLTVDFDEEVDEVIIYTMDRIVRRQNVSSSYDTLSYSYTIAEEDYEDILEELTTYLDSKDVKYTNGISSYEKTYLMKPFNDDAREEFSLSIDDLGGSLMFDISSKGSDDEAHYMTISADNLETLKACEEYASDYIK